MGVLKKYCGKKIGVFFFVQYSSYQDVNHEMDCRSARLGVHLQTTLFVLSYDK